MEVDDVLMPVGNELLDTELTASIRALEPDTNAASQPDWLAPEDLPRPLFEMYQKSFECVEPAPLTGSPEFRSIKYGCRRWKRLHLMPVGSTPSRFATLLLHGVLSDLYDSVSLILPPALDAGQMSLRGARRRLVAACAVRTWQWLKERSSDRREQNAGTALAVNVSSCPPHLKRALRWAATFASVEGVSGGDVAVWDWSGDFCDIAFVASDMLPEMNYGFLNCYVRGTPPSETGELAAYHRYVATIERMFGVPAYQEFEQVLREWVAWRNAERDEQEPRSHREDGRSWGRREPTE